MSYAFSRRDGNHDAIAAALHADGWQVMDTHACKGNNARADEGWFDNPGDLIVCNLNSAGTPVVVLVECKMPGASLRKGQERLQRFWRGLQVVAHSPENAVELCRQSLLHSIK